MPMVSVIMPAYNAGKTIESAVNSVLEQTYCDFELIIVNDCSEDNTEKIIADFLKKDKRISYLKNERNSGVSYSRNRAVEYASGKWIAFIDSDDMWEKSKLEKQINVIEHNEDAVLIYTASSFISEDDERYRYILSAEEKINYSNLLKRNLISCSSVVVKASVMKNIKMPDDSMHEDYFSWLTILKKYKYAYGINEPLLIYRLCKHSKSSNRIKSAKMLYNTYHALGYTGIKAFLLVCRYAKYSIMKRYSIKRSGYGKQ